jgi:hypothetical protein
MDTSPTDDELLSFIKKLKVDHNDFGIKRITNLIKTSKPIWVVSEKRIKKIMQVSS